MKKFFLLFQTFLLVLVLVFPTFSSTLFQTTIEEFQKEFPNARVEEEKKERASRLPNNSNIRFLSKILSKAKKDNQTDSYYRGIIEDMLNIQLYIYNRCFKNPLRLDPTGIGYLASIQVCQELIQTLFPGSYFSPSSGGKIISNNVIFFLTDSLSITKIVDQSEITKVIIPFEDREKKEIKFAITVAIPESGAKAQFTLGMKGIEEIQDISSIYNIQSTLQRQNVVINSKEIVFAMLEYYKFLKLININKEVNSMGFILSMLTSIERQQDFIEFYKDTIKQKELIDSSFKRKNKK